MPRRRRHGVVSGAALAALAAGLGACQADAGNANCQVASPVSLAGTPLTLLANARLDQVGAGYFLLGTDPAPTGTEPVSVRWAAIDDNGNLTGEQAFALPQGVTQAYFAMAGATAPGDTVIIGYFATDAMTGNGELAVIAVPADGTSPAAPAAPLVIFPGGIPPAASVAMSSSRLGNAAGLAWIDGAAGHVMLATINAAGALIAQPSDTSSQAAPAFSCLGFTPGNNALTVTYYAQTTSEQQPGWVIAEANEAGAVTLTTSLALGMEMGTCAVVTPTAAGYALVWQDSGGGWLAEYDTGASSVPSYPFASASSFGGPALQPPMVGLAPFGTDFGVLFARSYGGELWRVDSGGNRRPGALELPSAFGNIGGISALPVAQASGQSLLATYADYSSPAGTTTAGSRWFVNAVCY